MKTFIQISLVVLGLTILVIIGGLAADIISVLNNFVQNNSTLIFILFWGGIIFYGYLNKKDEKNFKQEKKEETKIETTKKSIALNELPQLVGAIENIDFTPSTTKEWAKYHYNDAKMFLKIKLIENAKEKFIESLNNDESFFQSANELINLYKITGELDKGIQLINKIITYYKSSDRNLLLYYKADLNRLKGDFKESLLIIKSVIKEFPNDYKTYLLRGEIYLMNKQNELAKKDYKKVAEKSPITIKSSPDSILNFVVLFEEELSYSKKVNLLKKSINLLPSWEFSYYNLGALMIKNKDYKEAVSYLLKAHEINEKDIKYIELIAQCYFQLKERILMNEFLIKGIHLGSEDCKINFDKLKKGII